MLENKALKIQLQRMKKAIEVQSIVFPILHPVILLLKYRLYLSIYKFINRFLQVNSNQGKESKLPIYKDYFEKNLENKKIRNLKASLNN